jgi:hypothetical protein
MALRPGFYAALVVMLTMVLLDLLCNSVLIPT